MEKQQYFELNEGDLRVWIEQEASIHIKAVTKQHLDPVELTESQARKLAHALLRMAETLGEGE